MSDSFEPCSNKGSHKIFQKLQFLVILFSLDVVTD